MTSDRVLSSYSVRREPSGSVVILIDSGYVEVELSPSDLCSLLTFSVTGAEPPPTEEELRQRDRSKKLADTIERLMKPTE